MNLTPVPEILEVHIPEAAIAAAIIVRDSRVLLVRRRVAEGSLSWQFPAGKMEPGETVQEAAAREAREEAGVMSAASRVLGERVHPVTSRRVVYVACDLVSGVPRVADEDEIAEVAWCDIGDLHRYVPAGFFAPVQAYLDAVIRT
jgi:8-oxo-dGTP diphosphatase